MFRRCRSDEEEIRLLLYKYCRGVDRADADLIRSVYHEDAVDDHGSFCLPVNDAVKQIVESVKKAKSSQHHLTNMIVRVQRNIAKSESYVICHMYEESSGGDRLRILGLRYIDCLSRRKGAWRISERLVVHDWSVCLPPLEKWAKADLLDQGTRDSSDPSFYHLSTFL